MQSDFDLNSPKWLSLIFEDKNKQYGAYVHRDESSDRHLKALIIITLVALGMIFLPKLVKTMMPAGKDIGQVVEVKLADLTLEQEVPEENTIKEIVVPPPPELKQTVQFTPPVIVEDEKIVEEQIMLTQQELTETTAQISISTVEGSETGTVDIADLADHKVIIEAPKEKEIFVHVEQMPEFPGGNDELMKWLNSNIIYPTIAQEQGIQGTVSIRFVVTPDGSVEDVTVVKSLDPSCDREAVAKVKKLPKFNPGKQNGNPVFVYFTLPVRFRLQNQ